MSYLVENVLLPKQVIDSCYAAIFRCYQEMFPTAFTAKSSSLSKRLSTDVSNIYRVSVVSSDLNNVHRLSVPVDELSVSDARESPSASPSSRGHKGGESKQRNPVQKKPSFKDTLKRGLRVRKE